MKQIKCRLEALMRQRELTLPSLSATASIPHRRLQQLCDSSMLTIDLAETSRLLEALSLHSLDELFEVVEIASVPAFQTSEAADEWHGPCANSDTGRHDWFRDAGASNSVYQEYECRICGRRIHLIW